MKYGTNHLLVTNSINAQDRRFINREEELLFWSSLPSNFIPYGLFFDLYDDNMSTPGISVSELAAISDNCAGYSFNQMYNALSANPVDILEFKQSLINTQGVLSTCGQTQLDDLFLFYGF